MKPLAILALAAFLPLAGFAGDAPAVFGPVPAEGVDLAAFLWLKRPLVVFADTPDDPAFQRQMALINAELGALEERDVVILTDTDPEARSPVRQRLRPRGFSLVLMDKDGEVKRRNPSPWRVREITHAIDRFPLRRQEMLDRRPSGR